MSVPLVVVPVVVSFGTLLVTNDHMLVRVDAPATVRDPVSGSLRGLTTGPFVARVRNEAGLTIATLTWNASGLQTAAPSNTVLAKGDRLRFDITGLGVGAADLAVTVWLALGAA